MRSSKLKASYPITPKHATPSLDPAFHSGPFPRPMSRSEIGSILNMDAKNIAVFFSNLEDQLSHQMLERKKTEARFGTSDGEEARVPIGPPLLDKEAARLFGGDGK
jgi:hypothetical protein